MNSENIKDDNPLQLQQMIIFLKSEVAKYKNQVEQYKDSDHYSLIAKLEQENSQLTNEKNGLSKQLLGLKNQFEKQASVNHDRLKIYEMQIENEVALVDALQVKNAELWTMNKQLTEAIKNANYGFITNQRGNRKQDRQVSALHSKLDDYKETIDQLEDKLVDFIQLRNKQVHSELEKLDRSNQRNSQAELLNQDLLKEYIEKHKDMNPILEKGSIRKNESQFNTDSSSLENTLKTKYEALEQLESRINKVVIQSLDYEEELEAKLLLLNELEHKLEQLTLEVDDIKIINEEEQVLKKR